MITINDMNVSLDLDKAAVEAVIGGSTHYSSSTYKNYSKSYGAWGTTYSTLVSSNVWIHGVRHNKYWQRKYRKVSYIQRKSWYKYVG